MNPDFKELLLAFDAHNVEYLIVGAHALAAHGHVRATKDLDLWVRPEQSSSWKRRKIGLSSKLGDGRENGN